ncbi:MAG: HEAT repeat domain-containing protein [Verrucomicrobiota bacterium]
MKFLLCYQAVLVISCVSMSGCKSEQTTLQHLLAVQRKIEHKPTNVAAINELLSMAKSRHVVVRVNALGMCGKVYPAVDENTRKQIVAIFIEASSHPEHAVRRAMAETCAFSDAELGGRLLKELQNALKEDNSDVSWFAARSLGKVGPKASSTISALLGALKAPPAGTQDTAPQLRIFAVDAIRRIVLTPTVEVKAALENAAQDSNDYFAIEAVKTLLGLMPDNSVGVMRLRNLENSKSGMVRSEAEEFRNLLEK